MKQVIQQLKAILPAKEFIVTGSYALSLYGLTSDVKDIDIILVSPEQSAVDVVNNLMAQFPAKTKPKKIELPTTDAKVGTVKKVNPPLQAIFMYNNVKVDVFFTESTSPTVEIDSIKYSTIPHIIKAKKAYGRMKDWLQCRDMARSIFKQEDFDAMLNGNWKSSLKVEY